MREPAWAEERGPSVRGTIAVLWTRRRLIASIALVVVVFTMALSLVMPRLFVARATLLPPVSSSSNLWSMPGLEASLGLLGIQDESVTTAKLFQQILNSRTVMEEVIRTQNLIAAYRLDDRPPLEAMEIAVQLLRAGVHFGVSDAGLIEITARFSTSWFAGKASDDETRQRAAAVANTFVEQLDQVNREKSLSRAKQTRLYLERQLNENQETLLRLGSEIASFQSAHGAVALDFQTKALIETAAQLKGRLLAREVELGIAQQTMTRDNPVVVELASEIANLRKGLASLDTSPSAAGNGESIPTDLTARRIPELQARLAAFEREIQAQLLLEGYLNQQYYQAKIQEARDAPTIQVLDAAIPPIERFSPKRKLMAVAGLLSGLILGTIAAAILEGLTSGRGKVAAGPSR